MDLELSSLLDRLEGLSTRKDVREELGEVLEEFTTAAERHGLDDVQLARGYALALGGHLSTPHAVALLHQLLPRSPVSAPPILRIISVIGEQSNNKALHRGRVEYKTQKKALEGLNVLLEVGAVSREGLETLQRFWGVIARGLEYGTLRDATASLLFVITRRYHVQEHRIAHLQRLLRTLDSPPASLVRLLDLFRSIYPELVLPSTIQASGSGSGRSAAKERWADRIRKVLQSSGETTRTIDGRASKRRRTTRALIPSGATITAGTTSTVLSDISSLAELAAEIEKLDLPSQAGGILNSVPGAGTSDPKRSDDERFKAWALVIGSGYGNDVTYIFRLTTFLSTLFYHELCDLDETPEGSARVEDLLCRVRGLSEMGGELIEAFEPVLVDYLQIWNGESHREVIFDLIALHKPLAYEHFFARVLEPLQRLSVSGGPEWIADMLSCLSSLVTAWALRSDLSSGAGEKLTTFGALEADVNYRRSLQGIVEYVDRIISASILTYPNSLTLRSASLSFYETSLSLPLQHGVAFVVIPTPTFTYSCLASDEAMSVSRICGIISHIRDALTSETSAIETNEPRNQGLVDYLNGYLLNVVNAIWQKRFLDDESAAGSMGITKAQLDVLKDWTKDREQLLSYALGITVHPAFATLARSCLQDMVVARGLDAVPIGNGPIVQANLKDLSDRGGLKIPFSDFRVGFLEDLKEQGAEGIHRMLFASLSTLINRKEKMAGMESSQL